MIYKKIVKKSTEIHKRREHDFQMNLDNLFDIAHADALQMIKIEEDKVFLQQQREPGRQGCLAGVDQKLSGKEDRARQRKIDEEKRRLKATSIPESSSSYDYSPLDQSPTSSVLSDRSLDEPALTLPVAPQVTVVKRGRKDFISPKLVAALDRCQLSTRDSVYVLQATIEALDLNIDDYPVNKSSIQRIRTQTRRIEPKG